MLKINLQDELEKERKKSIDNSEGVIKDIKLLVAGQNDDEKQALKAAGLGHAIEAVEKATGINLERQTFEEKFSGHKVFTESEINDLAIKYDLRFLNTWKYNGTVDLELGKILVEFFKNNGLDMSNGYDSGRLYILAPKKLFNLKKRERPHRPRLRLDPVIFYKISDRETGPEGKYVFIHQWGNDFSFFRYLRGFFFESATSAYWLSFGIFMMAWLAFFGLIGFGLTVSGLIGVLVGSTLLSLFSAFIILAILTRGDMKNSEKYFNSENWNEDTY